MEGKVCSLCGNEIDNLIYNLATNFQSCWRCLGEPDCWMLRQVEVRTKHGTMIHLVHANSNKEAFEKIGIDPEFLEMIARPLPN